jgi:hypothetical protein
MADLKYTKSKSTSLLSIAHHRVVRDERWGTKHSGQL